MSSKPRFSKNPFFIKLTNWEYWPTGAFYYPLIPYFIYLAIKAKHPCFFSATNSGLEAGGIGFESKYHTILKIPKPLRPKTILIPQDVNKERLIKDLKNAALVFPLIVKPEVGYRGLLVKKVYHIEQLIEYIRPYSISFIAQEFLDYPEEVGVLYYRLPNQKKGQISSLTLKKFLTVTGDGISTLESLILQDGRAQLQLPRIRQTSINLERVPEQKEVVPLGEIGNHSKGTQFINGHQYVDQELLATFDKLVDQIPGINYGRFDIKCNSLVDLKAGKNFKIIELNGVFSEPTHIYDATSSTYWVSLNDLRKHWGIVQRIGTMNHKNGVPYWPLGKMLKALWNFKKYARLVQKEKKQTKKAVGGPELGVLSDADHQGLQA